MPENDESTYTPTHLNTNWRQVWLWSAVISGVLSCTIAFGILGFPGSEGHTLWQYFVLWTGFTALLTVIGVMGVLRVTFDYRAEAERLRQRQAESANSPVAAATTQILSWIVKTLGSGGNVSRNPSGSRPMRNHT